MKKEIETALVNINVIVANTPLKRDEHTQLMNDIKLVSDECEKASTLGSTLEDIKADLESVKADLETMKEEAEPKDEEIEEDKDDRTEIEKNVEEELEAEDENETPPAPETE